MTLRPDRFLVVAIVRELDSDGREIAEVQIDGGGQPTLVLGGVEGLVKWAEEFPTSLAKLEQKPSPNRRQRRGKPPTKRSA